MRKTLTLTSVVLLSFLSIAAIKFFTDYPNSVPADSDFFVLQRNQSYINASQAQVRGLWFTSPSFTGNATFGGNLTVNAPFQYFGDGSQLSGIPSSSVINSASNMLYQLFSQTTNGMFILANNGNGTNTTNWGVSSFQEVDAVNFFPTNLFTGDTNWDVVGTDANGQLKKAIPVAGTNLFLVSGANITFTTNGDGSITIAASGSVNIQTITNTTLYTTNAYITTVYATTNFSTNLFFVSGKGNTLIITNVSVENTLTNKGVAASSAVITDASQVETNAVNAHGVFTNTASGPPSFGLLQSTEIAPGISPTLNLVNSTNLTYQYTTNAVSNGALTFGAAYRTNINADITLASYTLGPNGASMYESLVILATNSDTAVHKITHPSGVFTGGAAAVSWITNGYWNMIVVDHFANLYTNAQVKN